MTKTGKRVLIIGGHLSPALACIDQLKKRGWEIFWLGRRFSLEDKNIPSLEYEVIPNLGIKFFDMETGRLQRKFTSRTIPSLLRTIKGLPRAFSILRQTRPRIVLSFGGYLSVPVVVGAWILRVPVVLHEQTAAPGLGLANKIGAIFARKICVSYPSNFSTPFSSKLVLTGNPVRREILSAKRSLSARPLLYITGGGLGSQVINRAFSPILYRLVRRFTVVHQTGLLDYQKFRLKKGKLGSQYRPFATVRPPKVAEIYAKAWLIISRAGANTISEIAAVGVPAILIPIPWSERGEQEKNASLLENSGLARILPEGQLTPTNLYKLIIKIINNFPSIQIVKKARLLVRPDAAEKIVDVVENVA